MDYATWFFDCDGVLLDSNKLKTEAFYEVAEEYDPAAAQQLVDYHKQHGGISRFKKFEYFHQMLLGKTDCQDEVERSIVRFGEVVKQKLLECSETKGMRSFLEMLPPDSKRFVVSGGKQAELREIFEKRNLSPFFQGIYGSPDPKNQIMESLKSEVSGPSIFIGDSQYDYEIAQQFGCDFIFMSAYTEFSEWESFFASRNDHVRVVPDFDVLLKTLKAN